MAAELVGRRIAGRFTILRVLGQGGMATVYAAERDEVPREIALKIMSRSLDADPRFAKRFEREAQAASRVRHPNSVQIHAWGAADGHSYIAMELIAGVDLAAILDRDGPMSQRRAAWILAEACDALATAHDIGIVHRDLKPENVMIVPDRAAPNGERVKVLDFGIAKMLTEEGTADEPPDSDDAPTALTRTGTQLGTPAYMSPEQCQLLEVDARSDVYTCGILLYQMITGGVPFEGETPLHTATLHIREALVKPSTYAPHVDARLEAIAIKALEKKPGDRHQSARALAAELRALIPSLPDKPARMGGPPRSRKSGPHSPRRSNPPPAAGRLGMPISSPPPPMFGGRPLPAPIADEPSMDEDDARTVMRPQDGDDDNARTMMREGPADADRPPPPAPPPPGGPRRGTEMLDFNAPIASPSAPATARTPASLGVAPPDSPRAPRPPPPPPAGSSTLEAPTSPGLDGPRFVLAPPRAAKKGPSGIAALLLGFVVGVVLIGVALIAYVFLVQR